MAYDNHLKKALSKAHVKNGILVDDKGDILSNIIEDSKQRLVHPSKSELLYLVKGFDNPKVLHASGFKIAGQKLAAIQTEDKVIVGKRGEHYVIAHKVKIGHDLYVIVAVETHSEVAKAVTAFEKFHV